MEEPTKTYWIVDDTIIFKPKFNEYLDDYTQIISNYKTLYFSNYNDPHVALKNNNIFVQNSDNLFCGSLFNQPLNNTLSNLINLQELTVGFFFVNHWKIPYHNWLI